MRRTMTTSSATSRWPWVTRSRAASLLPIPLFPRMSVPRPWTSTRSAWSCVSGASCSSSHADAARMKSLVRRAGASTGTSAAAAAWTSGAGAAAPLGTTKQGTPGAATKGLFLQQTRDAREPLQVRTRRVLRRYEKEEEVGRLPVERLEIDAREAPPEGRQHALQAGQLAVRDGNAVPERGAVQALAVLERLDQPLPVDLAVIAGEDAG